MTTIYKVTLWANEDAAVPLEITFDGPNAEDAAKMIYGTYNDIGAYHHGHIVSYEPDKPDTITPVVNHSFDVGYLNYESEDDKEDWSDPDDEYGFEGDDDEIVSDEAMAHLIGLMEVRRAELTAALKATSEADISFAVIKSQLGYCEEILQWLATISADQKPSYCQDCGIMVDFDVKAGDDIVRPAYVSESGDLYCDRCGRRQDEEQQAADAEGYGGDHYPYPEMGKSLVDEDDAE